MPDFTLLKASALAYIAGLIDDEANDRAGADTARSVAIRDTGTLTISSVAGTGDAITASLQEAMITAGITFVSGSGKIEYIPVATNLARNPTFAIAGTVYAVRNADGGDWPANGFVVGRCYTLRRRGLTLRVQGGEVTQTEISNEAAARLRADNLLGFIPLENAASAVLDGVETITASVPSNLTADGLAIIGNVGVRLIVPTTNTGATTFLHIAGDTPRAIMNSTNASPVAAGTLVGSRTILLTRRGGNWVMTSAATQEDVTGVAARAAAAVQEAGIIPLISIGGTGDAITAALNANVVSAGVTFVSGSGKVEYIPVATNLARNPTLTIGAATFNIRGPDGEDWPANGFVVGRLYLMRRFGLTLRVFSSGSSGGQVGDESFRNPDPMAEVWYSILRARDGTPWLGSYVDGSWAAPTPFGAFRWPGDDLILFETQSGEPIVAIAPDGSLIFKEAS